MSDIITTLHPENDQDTNLYPNIKKQNIPSNAVDYNKLDSDVKSLLNSINELHPSGVDTAAHILAFTTNKGIYVGSDTHYWYYWNGTQYVSGGEYIADTSYDQVKDDISKLFENTYITEDNAIVTTQNGYVSRVDGTIVAETGSTAIKNVPIVDGLNITLYIEDVSKAAVRGGAYYDENNNYISGFAYTVGTTTYNLTIPKNAKKLSFTIFNDCAYRVYYHTSVFDIYKKTLNYDKVKQQMDYNAIYNGNKFEKKTSNSYVNRGDGNIYSNGTDYTMNAITNIPVVAGESLTLELYTVPIASARGGAFYDFKGDFISGFQFTVDTTTYNLTVPENAYFIGFTIFSDKYSLSYNDNISDEVVGIRHSCKQVNSITVSTITELKNAIDSIATSMNNNKANEFNIYNIYLKSGTYNVENAYTIADVQSDLSHTQFSRGLELPDYVNLIGLGNVTISLTLPNDATVNQVRTYSTINSYGACRIENINIEAHNCRYCVHGSTAGYYYNRKVEYINCSFKHYGVVNSAYWESTECIGSGLVGGTRVLISGCKFESDFIPIYFHNGPALWMVNRLFIKIENSAVITTHTYALDFEDANNTLVGDIELNGCYLTGKIWLKGTSKWKVYGGGNSNVLIDNLSSSEVFLVN